MGNGLVQNLTLAPGEITRVFLPSDSEIGADAPFELNLNRDTFPIDDLLLFLQTKSKKLRVNIVPTDVQYSIIRRVLGVLPAVSVVHGASAADVVFGESILARKDDSRATIFLPPPRAESEVLSQSPITAIHHQLTDGLQFEGLLVPPCRPYTPKAGDKVLVWQGDTPMILALKGDNLYINFSLSSEGIGRHPALVVLLHRYLHIIRKGLKESEFKSFDGGQLLELPQVEEGDFNYREKSMLTGVVTERLLSDTEARALRAPIEPSSFSVTWRGIDLLTGVSNFADPRESDFLAAQTLDFSIQEYKQKIQVHAQRDSLKNVWLIVAVLVALASWIPIKEFLAPFRRKI